MIVLLLGAAIHMDGAIARYLYCSILDFYLLHRPAKFYDQNVFAILMSDSDVIFAADVNNHICFSPSRQVKFYRYRPFNFCYFDEFDH